MERGLEAKTLGSTGRKKNRRRRRNAEERRERVLTVGKGAG
jgi:hypothetical protein